MTPEELKENVDTIVVVIMENRSFDHVLGHLKSPLYGNRKDVDGIDEVKDIQYINPNSDGQAITPFWMDDGPFTSDLPHGPDGIAKQMNYSAAIKSYLMNGFVQAFEDEFHTSVANPPVMGLLRPDSVPATGALASKYTVCDRWFACLPTSTAPNRLMSMCGYTDIRDTDVFVPNQITVYDWLLERGISWRVYYAGLPFLILMPRLGPLLLTSHFRPLSELAEDLAEEDTDDWPHVIFIEPDYYDCPIHVRGPCDNHAPLAMAPGELFLADVYKWLSQDKQRWSRTVFILTYDEHGGCFDHVPPLPVKYRNPKGVAFDTTGPRVPAIVAGPFAPKGVSHLCFDNTSILQLLADRFGRSGESYSSEVAGRLAQNISSVTSLLSVSAKNASPYDFASIISKWPTHEIPQTTVANKLTDGFDLAAKDLASRHKAEAFMKFPELKIHLYPLKAEPDKPVKVVRSVRVSHRGEKSTKAAQKAKKRPKPNRKSRS
jgi:phospholipase C